MNNEDLIFEAGQDYEEKEEQENDNGYDDLAQDPDYQRPEPFNN
jgi:hypothetical protein